MTNQEIHITEIRKDIGYIKERLDEKFLEINKHIEKSQLCKNRITKLETLQYVTWFLLTTIVVLWLKK